MTLPIERARSRRPITWLTVLGVLLLPALIGGILVAALQEPTERLDEMTAAVVNLDEPVTIDGQYTPLGRQLAAGLVEGSDELDSNLTWVISNKDDAAEGMSEGRYQAVVTIPKSFSADATSAGTTLKDGEGAAEQAEIRVTTPPDGRVADGLISQQIATAAASTLGTMLSEATVENVLIGFTTLGDQIGDAADGADQLADGARSAADGASEIPGGAAKLADGANGLADGAAQLAGGAGELASGADALAGGLGTIAGKAREAGSGATQLGQGLTSGASALERDGIVPAQLLDPAGLAAKAADGAAKATAGAAQASTGVKDGLDEIAPGLSGLAASCNAAAQPEFCGQLEGLAAGTEKLRESAKTAADLADTAAKATDGAQRALTGVASGLGAFNEKATAEIAGQLRTAGAAASQLGGGLGQLADGVDQSATGARQLSDGAGQVADGNRGLADGAHELGDGATALGDGAGELADGLDELASGTGDLAEGLHTAATSLPAFDQDESKSLASVIADPVTASSNADELFGPTTIPLLSAVVLWFGALATFLVLRAVPGSALTSRRSSIGMVLRGFWPAAAIGAAQGLLLALVVQFVAEYDAATWWGFAAFAVTAGVAFAAVVQALVTVLGGIGRWVSALIGVLAFATGLISTVPGWLAGLGAALPTAPALNGLIAPSGADFAGLVIWAVLALGAATLAVATRRTTSAKAVLARA
ncbi:YhgE/Pip domain-containing protein [Microbacterium sp. USHLN186]|uniref:YhgE/Pip domain-containing protein n=1 Tax=Microbacterium sp. USHLN186 TaxID=3081286 RepID=UPI0030172D94